MAAAIRVEARRQALTYQGTMPVSPGPPLVRERPSWRSIRLFLDFFDEAIGRVDLGDTGKRELLDQAILEVPNVRSERPRASGE
jgi:hypothetical protein